MKNKGFSLVELIVVIAIMAILVGVAVPVYTSYISKANAAKDEQLLGEINSAFMVAAIDNNIDFSKLTSDNNKINIDANGKVTFALYDVSTTDDVDLNADVAAILPGELTFKTIEEVWYNKNTRCFEKEVISQFDYYEFVLNLSSEDIAKLKGSAFINSPGLGVNGLLDKVGQVVDFASEFESGVYESLFEDEEYMRYICSAMGVANASELEGDALFAAYETAMGGAIRRKTAMLAGVDVEDVTDELVAQYYDQTSGVILANSAVLFAADNASSNSESIMTLLKSEKPIDEIKGSLSDSYGAGLTNASVAYAMYTAYAYSSGDASLIAKTENPVNILNGLDDEGFQNYLNTPEAQNDLEGYLSAMNMINGSVEGNSDAVNTLLVNGFDDATLKNLLGEAVGE